MELLLAIGLLALLSGFLSGLLGIGGGIIMAPLLLFGPRWLGMQPLSMHTVAGLPIVPGLVALGCTVRARSPLAAAPLSAGLARAWPPSQVLLFGLIGWAVDLGPLTRVGLLALVVLLAGQGARALGSLVSSAGESLTGRERLAAAAAYVPKATIQAAFAAVPLDRGLPEGGLVLGVGVLAVVIWAPLGVLSLMKGVPRLLARPGAPQRAERTS